MVTCDLKKHEVIILLLAAAFICFCVGFFAGRSSVHTSISIETLSHESVTSDVSEDPPSSPEVNVDSNQADDTAAAQAVDMSVTDAPSPEAEDVKMGLSESININTAAVVELETLPRIGPVLAERIIAYREENGSFESIEEIVEVKGIGEATYEALKDRITI